MPRVNPALHLRKRPLVFICNFFHWPFFTFLQDESAETWTENGVNHEHLSEDQDTNHHDEAHLENSATNDETEENLQNEDENFSHTENGYQSHSNNDHIEGENIFDHTDEDLQHNVLEEHNFDHTENQENASGEVKNPDFENLEEHENQGNLDKEEHPDSNGFQIETITEVDEFSHTGQNGQGYTEEESGHPDGSLKQMINQLNENIFDT